MLGERSHQNFPVLRQTWHEDLSSLERSQLTGCFICKGTRSWDVAAWVTGFTRSTVAFESCSAMMPKRDQGDTMSGDYAGILFMEVVDDRTEISFSGCVKMTPCHPHPPRAIYANTRACTSTGDERVAALAKHWLWHCVENHPHCTQRRPEKWYRTRLLFLDAGHVRLVDSSFQLQGDTTRPYATLSHCWGKDMGLSRSADGQIHFLDDVTEADLRSGLDLHLLPQTFQDAVVTIERIGLSLIWIDCYCIKQQGPDSLADKQREIRKMERVYANAIINIGATAATDPSAGCFRSRDPSISEPDESRWRSTPAHEHSLFCLGSSHEPRHWEIREQPLMKRGWVLQERMLCSRMIHFTDRELIWECNSVPIASEFWVHGEPSVHSQKWQRLHPFQVTRPRHGQSLAHTGLLQEWWRTVEMYSEMELSRPAEDKFVAIAGIAQRFASVFGVDYVAGLWRQTLVRDLMWEPGGLYKSRTAAEHWRAPSWSWASMDCSVAAQYKDGSDEYRALCSVIDVDIRLSDPHNSFGALVCASLKLRGRLLQTRLDRETTGLPHGNGRVLTIQHEPAQVYFDLARDRIEDIHLFVLCSWRRPGISERIEGLSLEGFGDGVYRRIGTFYEVEEGIYSAAMAHEEVEITIV